MSIRLLFVALYLIMQRGTPEQLKIEYSVTAQKILVSFRMKYIGVCFIDLAMTVRYREGVT